MIRSSALLVAACVLSLPAANASTLTDNFTITGNGTTSSGTLTLTSTSDPNVYDITGITGTFFTSAGFGISGPITALEPSSYSAAHPVVSALGLYDNLFFPSASGTGCLGQVTALLDLCGLNFIVGNRAAAVGIYSSAPGTYDFYAFSIPDYDIAIDEVPISFTIAPATTPEPSTFLLLGTGLAGALCALSRSSRASVRLKRPTAVLAR